MLPCEVRCCFFQERVLHLEFADAAFQLPDPLVVRHIGRQRLPGEFLPVRLYPEPERSIVDIEFPRHLGNRPRRRGVDHFLYGLLLELRSVMLRFSWHLIPFLSGENPIGFPVRKIWGTSHGADCPRPGKHPRAVHTGPGPHDWSWKPLACRTHAEVDQRFAPGGDYAAGNLMVAIPRG